jgi:hypothetical protein
LRNNALLDEDTCHRFEAASIKRKTVVFIDTKALKPTAHFIKGYNPAGAITKKPANSLDLVFPMKPRQFDLLDFTRRISANIMVAF